MHMSSTAAQERDWSSLPGDLLKTILELLPWSSHPRFAATCKHLRSVVSPFYPAGLTPLLLNTVNVGSTCIRYYSPYYHKNFKVSQTLQTPGAKLCCANGHRLTLCQEVDTKLVVVDADLVTGDIYDLFPLEHTGFDFVVYNGSQRIFSVSAMGPPEIARSIEADDGGWHPWELTEFDPEGLALKVSPMTNPILHRGQLYLLGTDGRLAVHDDNRHNEGFWILDKPNSFGFECDDYYLFESDDN